MGRGTKNMKKETEMFHNNEQQQERRARQAERLKNDKNKHLRASRQINKTGFDLITEDWIKAGLSHREALNKADDAIRGITPMPKNVGKTRRDQQNAIREYQKTVDAVVEEQRRQANALNKIAKVKPSRTALGTRQGTETSRSGSDEINAMKRQIEAMKKDTLNRMKSATPESARYLVSRGVKLSKEEYYALPADARRAYTQAVDDAIAKESPTTGFQWRNYWRNEGIQY